MKGDPKEIQMLRDELLAHLASLLDVPPEYDPCSMVSVEDWASYRGVSKDAAYQQLEKLVEQGKLEKIRVRYGNRKGVAYYPKE